MVTPNALVTHSAFDAPIMSARHRLARGVAAPVVLIALSRVRVVRAGGLIDSTVVIGRRLVVARRTAAVTAVMRPTAGRRVATILAHVRNEEGVDLLVEDSERVVRGENERERGWVRE